MGMRVASQSLPLRLGASHYHTLRADAAGCHSGRPYATAAKGQRHQFDGCSEPFADWRADRSASGRGINVRATSRARSALRAISSR